MELLASRIPEAVIDQVRTSVNITDVVSEYVQLHKQGRNLFGKCPWHDERTPSFSVNEDKQIFHCFSCGRGGNVFQFLIELQNLSFPEAVVKVAEIAHVSIDPAYTQTKAVTPVSSENGQLYELYTEAAKLYHHMLVNTAQGEASLEYLQKRGLDDQTIDLFSLGYAPSTPLLLPYFQEKGTDYQLLRQSELFVVNDDGTLRDRFVNRVLFTIRNAQGQVIAFSGRSLEPNEQAKYINSPESKIFNKSKELFNFDLARQNIRRAKTVILFEGFMDVIAAYSSGLQNGVASMGTSLTQDQVRLLDRVTDKVLIAYDGDNAGQEATKRAIGLIGQFAPNIQVQVVHLPDGLDPDEYLRKYGADEFVNVFSHALETPVAFAMRYLKKNRNLANEADKLAYIDDVLAVIATGQNPVERDLQLNQLVAEFGISRESLQGQLQQLLLTNRAQAQQQEAPYQDFSGAEQSGAPYDLIEPVQVTLQVQKRPRTKVEKAERTLLLWMLHNHNIWQEVTAIQGFHFAHSDYEALFLMAQGYKATHLDYDVGGFLDFVGDDKLQRLLTDIENDDFVPEPNMVAVKDYVTQIMHDSPLEEQIASKAQQINEAKQLGNAQLQIQLTNEYIELLRQRQAKR